MEVWDAALLGPLHMGAGGLVMRGLGVGREVWGSAAAHRHGTTTAPP